MFHGTLTLLARSLRLDALQGRPHAFRICSIAVVFVLLVATHIYTGGRGSPGLRFFALICQLCLGLITVAGAGHFSTAITEEKEGGTLNLLLLANVPALAILVGKSTTRVVSVLLVFAGIFPFMLLALALGGATVHQVWSGLLALSAYMVLVANIGLFASVVRRTSSGAALVTIAFLLAVLAAPFLMSRLTRSIVAVGWTTAGSGLVGGFENVTRILRELSIVTRISRIQATGFSESAWSEQVIWSLVLAAMLFGLSWLLFRKFCEYLGEEVPSRVGLLKIRGGSTRPIWRRLLTPRTWANALAWKDFNFLVGGVPGLLFRTLMIPLIAVGLFAIDQLLDAGMRLRAPDALRLAILLLAGMDVLSLSSRLFSSEYRRQTLCTLALLPRSTIALCYSKLAGCSLAVLPYGVWFLVIGAWYNIEVPELAQLYLLEPQAIAWGCLALVLVHLTAWLSLKVKWGALPLALMILMVLSSCASPYALVLFISGNRQAASASDALPVVYLTMLVCTVLQIAIGVRFRTAAAE